MSRIPKCPVCATLLTTDRTLSETWVRRHPDPDLWVYKLSCAKCLCIASVEIPEISALTRSQPSRATVDVGGGVVARLFERIRGVEDEREGLRALVVETSEDAERALLLRIPEVLALVRKAYGSRVVVPRSVRSSWMAEDPLERLTLSPAGDGDTRDGCYRAEHGITELVIRGPSVLTVRGVEGGRLLGEADGSAAWRQEWVTGNPTLVIWPDLVRPTPGS